MPSSAQDFYLGNPNLKKVGTEIEFTQEQIQEYLKCKADPCILCYELHQDYIS